MPKITLVRGLPASGKSTKIKEKIQKSKKPAVRVGRDFGRDEFFGTRIGLTREQEDLITVADKAKAVAFLQAGVDVYIDAMNLHPKSVLDWAKFSVEHSAEFEIWDEFLSVPLEECIKRDAAREGEARLGEKRMWEIYSRHFPLKPINGLDDILSVEFKPYTPPLGARKAYIFDIDGTCTTGPFDRSPYDWMKVHQDQPNWSVVNTAISLWHRGYEIIFCSGRSEECVDGTLDWLIKHFGAEMMSESPLFMRSKNHLQEKDYLTKLRIFNENIRHHYDVVGVFDDRPQVIRMWRRLGLTVFQLNDKEF